MAIGEHVTSCPRPSFRKGRWEHKLWICSCGQAWRTQWHGAGDGGCWTWERWPAVSHTATFVASLAAVHGNVGPESAAHPDAVRGL